MTATIAISPEPVRLQPREAFVRFGLIALATDLTSEGDHYRLLAGPGVALHVTRVPYANPTTPENLARMAPALGEAASLLAPDEPLAAIVYSCTSASAVIGEEAVAAAVGSGKPGVPVVTPTGAAVAAFRALGARRISVLTPYTVRTTGTIVDHFAAAGLSLSAVECLGMEDDREMARVEIDTIVAAALAVDRPDAEAIFVSCTGLRAVDAIAAIEARTKKPVVTSNQATAWALRRAGGLAAPVAGFGQLLATQFADAAAEPAA